MEGRYRILGRTGLSVFEIGFGAWPIGGSSFAWAYGPTDDRASLRAIQTSLEMGCTFFDTADSYGNGHSEALLGQALQGHRSHVAVATKVGFDFYQGLRQQNFHPAYVRFALHQSLRRLKTDYVDLYQLHNPPPIAFCSPDVIDALQRLRERGKVRWLGVSAASVPDAIEAVQAGWPDAIQVAYNILAPEAEQVLFPMAMASQIGIIAREPLANGFLTGKYGPDSVFLSGDIRSQWPADLVRHMANQVEMLKPYCWLGETLAQLAIRFVLESQAVSVALCGCKSAGQVKENFVAGRRVQLL